MQSRREFLKTAAVVPFTGTAAVPKEKYDKGQEILNNTGLTVSQQKTTPPHKRTAEWSDTLTHIDNIWKQLCKENGLPSDWHPAEYGAVIEDDIVFDDCQRKLKIDRGRFIGNHLHEILVFTDKVMTLVNAEYNKRKQCNQKVCKEEIRENLVRGLFLQDIRARLALNLQAKEDGLNCLFRYHLQRFLQISSPAKQFSP